MQCFCFTLLNLYCFQLYDTCHGMKFSLLRLRKFEWFHATEEN